MQEIQRQAYLEALAIDSYSPRVLLSGALPSPIYELAVVEKVIVDEVLDDTSELIEPTASAVIVKGQPCVAKSGSVEGGPAAAAQALFDDMGTKNSSVHRAPAANTPLRGDSEQTVTTLITPTTPIATTANPSDAVKSLLESKTVRHEAPQFSLSIIRGSNVLVIDEGLEGHINPKDYLQLVHNLLFAVGAGKQSLSIDAFIWPMTRNSQVDQSETAARQALDSFLDKQLQTDTQYVLLMGETAAYYLSGITSLSAQVFSCSSVSPLLSEPQLKASLWLQLQPLKNAFRQANESSR